MGKGQWTGPTRHQWKAQAAKKITWSCSVTCALNPSFDSPCLFLLINPVLVPVLIQKIGEIDCLTKATSASALLCLAATVGVSQLSWFIFCHLHLQTKSRNASDKRGVTIGGTRCHHGPMGWELKRVTGNFCVFCRLDRHSTALRFGFPGPWLTWPLYSMWKVSSKSCSRWFETQQASVILSPCSKNAMVSL